MNYDKDIEALTSVGKYSTDQASKNYLGDGIYLDRENLMVLVVTTMVVNLTDDEVGTVDEISPSPSPSDLHTRFTTRTELPLALFKPYQVKVNVPKEFISESVITSQTSEIRTPITFKGYSKDVVLSEEIQQDRNGILSLVKKLLLSKTGPSTIEKR